METRVCRCLVLLFLLAGIGCGSSKPKVVAEADPVPPPLMEGPTVSSGVESATVLGSIDLEDEFSSTKGRNMRAREIVLSPGGEIAVHRHDSRPSIAYIISGRVVERRKDGGTQVRRAGDVVLETNGLVHWWKNEGTENAHVVVVDIITDDFEGIP